MSKLNIFEAIKRKARGEYIPSSEYSSDEKIEDAVKISERLTVNMKRSIELQGQITIENKSLIFSGWRNSNIRAELKALNKQIRRDSILLEKILYLN